ncbi:hypothetical protein KGF56_001593 [Candida oxycetoniae]|uniref:tRNA/rRNA methyltransferase SpoU type domain-containing protein n=1 Tax=Candida oxycetoniae TaxID=497107 RepID=A0AAI9WZ62_9ASCO|nr:uncharacterized protein KGF56_001593 [Candida oxycetoniae]KAI3405575.2 hypothetical protein KGF56_001593 [Candida oxycetoniae]
MKTAIAGLISKYLDDERRSELIESVAKLLDENEENVELLIELLSVGDNNNSFEKTSSSCNSLNAIEQYIQKYLLQGTHNEAIARLVHAIPVLQQGFIARVTRLLLSYISQCKSHFDPAYLQIFEFSKSQETSSFDDELLRLLELSDDDELLRLLELMEVVFKSESEDEGETAYIKATNLDHLLLLLLGIDEKQISDKVSSLLRWRIGSLANDKEGDFNLFWKVVFTLKSLSKPAHCIHHSYRMWLRYLSFTKNAKMQQLFQEEYYWAGIQTGLSSDSREIRKFALSILTLTIKSINVNLQNRYFRWNTDEKQFYLDEWARFITLYEILAIDTSLHQAEAGIKDISNLISTKSAIPPSWGWGLLAIGFKATIESVRKFTMRLLLSIPPENLYLIRSALSTLEKDLLPNLMMASHLNVRTVDGIPECGYVQKLRNFIFNMIKYLNDDTDCQNVAYSILKVLAETRDGFAPARILVLQGMLEGLSKRKVLLYGIHDIPLLELIEKESDSNFHKTYIQTLNLRLLLNFEHDLPNFLKALSRFVKFNGYAILHQNLSIIRSAVREEDLMDHAITNEKGEWNEDEEVLLIGLTGRAVNTETNKPLLLAKLLEAGFLEMSPKLTHLFSSKDSQIIEVLSRAKFNDDLSISNDAMKQLWNEVIFDLQSADIVTLTSALKKYVLFNKLYASSKFKFENWKEILKLKKKMLVNAEEVTKTDKFFYKVKDDLEGEYFVTLFTTYCKDGVQFNDITFLLDPTAASIKGRIAITKLILCYLDSTEPQSRNNIAYIVDFLNEMWSYLSCERLNLIDRELHILIIKALLHTAVLSSEAVAGDVLKEFCKSVLLNSTARRSLFPALVSCLANFQLYNSEQFERLTWLPEVLVRANLVFQPRNSYFKLTNILAEMYDKEVALNKDSNIYEENFGVDEESSRAQLMAIFNLIKSESFSQQIYNYVIGNAKEYGLFDVVKRTDSYEEWNRLQVYSILVSIVDKLEIDFDLFLARIDADPSPLVRMYIEWIIAYNILQKFELASKIFDPLEKRFQDLKPSVITSYQRILFLSIVHLPRDEEVEQMTKLINDVVVVGATSQKRMIRHFSLSMIISIKNEIDKKSLQVPINVKHIIDNLSQGAVTSDSFSQYRSGDSLIWNIIDDLNLTSIAGGIILKVTDRDDIDFITKSQFEKYLSAAQIKALRHPIGEDQKELWAREQQQQHHHHHHHHHHHSTPKKDIITPPFELDEQLPLQTKSGAWNSITNIDDSSTNKELKRSELIVAASLVDKPPNLGGICRLSDVLGAGLLTIHDAEIVKHPQFKNVAVTADRWMPMIEVKLENIGEYLKAKKREGYTLIGLEQTDKSVELNSDLVFPKKSLILLGREKEGIPGKLLSELDFCVEIKQVGVIRSMNIQTATAIIVHAYSCQHC